MHVLQLLLGYQIGKFRSVRSSTVRCTVLAVALLASMFLAAPVLAQFHPNGRLIRQDEPGSFVTGQIVVGLKPGTTNDQFAAALRAARLEVMRPLRLARYYLLRVLPQNGNPVTDGGTLDAARVLRDTNLFGWARPNYKMWKADTIPNDPMYKDQWHYPLINMPKAWDLTTGVSNVILACLDTGTDVNHPDLKDAIAGTRNFTVQPNTPDVTDVQGHGTHVSGTMSAMSNNGVGVAGVAYGRSPLFIGKVLGDAGFGTLADIADGVMYVADVVKTPANQVVINMSLGGEVGSDEPDLLNPVEAAVFYAATQKNCLVMMCAQNWFEDGNPPVSPARAAKLDSRLFCIVACGPQKEKSSYSIARPYSSLSAPGGNGSFSVISTFPNGAYGGLQGTSMATPHVSGVAALMLGVGAPPDQIKGMLSSTADTGGRPVPSAEFGYGVIDANAAITLANTGTTFVSPMDGSFVYGNVTITLKTGDPTKYLKAELQIDGDPQIIDTAGKGDLTLVWPSEQVDPTTGNPRWGNGTRRITVTVTTPTGPVKLARSVRLDNPIAQITSPAASSFVSKSVNVVGTADGLRIPTYNLEYATAANPTQWVSLVSGSISKVSGGTLGSWTPGAAPDGGITLRLRVKNPDGYEVAATRAVTLDQTPPAIPTGLTGVGSHLTATLNWSASNDPTPGQLAGYNLYRSRQSLTGYEKINPTVLSSTNFVDSGLINAFTYFYKVSAVDLAGNESAPTDIRDVTPNRNGTVSGQVVALDGSFLEGVNVSVQQNGTTVANGTAKTDSAGQFAFPGPPGFEKGTYDVKVEKPGYVGQMATGVSVDIGRDALAQNFALQPQPQFGSGWSMFTLPYNFGGAAMGSVFSGGNVKYYDPIQARYVDPGDPAFPAPAPGVGYWLLKSGTPQVTGAGIPNKNVTPVAIPIRKGWNLLGNPFQDSIHWVLGNLVVKRADNGQQATLNLAVSLGWALDFAWSGKEGKSLIFDRGIIPAASDTIPGYGAFWFRSEVDGTLSIAPPSVVSRAARENKGHWTLQLAATAGEQSASAYIGVSGTHRVFPLPPQVTSGVRLVLGDKGTNAADLRNNIGTTQTWDVTVDNTDSKAVTLTWPGSALVPRGWNLALVDKATGQRVNLRTTSSFTLPATRASHKLQIELTRETSVDRIMITDLVVNTTRGAAPAISYNLAKEGRATVSILKANGDTVRTLASRSVKSGQNALVWDTKDDQGRSVSPGVYLVQVKAVGDKGDQAKAIMPVVITR